MKKFLCTLVYMFLAVLLVSNNIVLCGLAVFFGSIMTAALVGEKELEEESTKNVKY